MFVSFLLLLSIFVLGAFFLWLLRRRPLASFVATVVLLFGIGLALSWARIPYLPGHLSESLGHACIVAAILALTVDYYLKNRVLREVSADVSKYLIGYQLPAEVQNRIRDLLQTRWIRRNSRMLCRITEIPDQAGKIKLEVTVTDELENITAEEDKYCEVIEYEKHDPERVVELRCDSTDARVCYALGTDELEERTKEKKDEPGVIEVRGKKIKILPRMNTIQRYQFTVKYEVILPETYSDVFVFGRATIGVEVRSECPGTIRFTCTPADVETPNRWEYRKLFLPGEHIRFRWRRERAQA